MKMPFSIKRFTIHRSSSLPTHGGSKKDPSAKDGPAKKGGAADKKLSSRPRGLPTSQSVDTADLRRYNNGNNNQEGLPEERVPPLPPHDRSRQFDWSSDPRNPGVRAVDGGPRWRSSSNKERGSRPPGDVGYEIRRAMARRNGNIRYPDNDYTEESQSSSSSGGTGRDYIEDQKISSNARWSNGRRGGRSTSSRGPGDWSEPSMETQNGPRHSGKRSQGRRHHPLPQEPQLVHDARQDLESVLPGRHPLYTTPPLVGYDEDPGIMSEVETSATGFRTTRTPKAPRIASFPPPLPRGVKAPQHPSERHLVGPVSPQLRHENLTLGLVFLQYRSETKRALLPNEVTTLDTVKALFVRSFPKQLTMEYLDSPHIRIYIHDPAKDMFYELEDLRDIRDRSVLRIYEQESNGEVYSTWEQELSYFSEPEFDSEYQNQHIHRAKGGVGYYGAGLSAYCPLAAQTLPPGPYSPPDRPKPPIAYAQTLPWGAHLTYAPSGPPSPERRPKEILIPAGVMQPPPKPQRSFQQAGTLPLGKGIRCTPPPPTGPPPSIPSPRSGMPRPLVDARVPAYPRFERRHEPQGGYRPERPYSAGAQPIYTVSPERHYEPTYRKSYEGGYLSSPERRYEPARSFPPAPVSPYEEPYYGGTERIYGTRSGSVTPVVDEEARLRVEHMERQLASLTGLVQKALAAPVRQTPPNQQIPTRDFAKDRGQGEGYSEARSSKSSSCASLADESSEPSIEHSHSKYSFKEEKSVSFSDETTTVSSPVHQKQHSPQHPAERPVKPAIKSSLSLRSQHSSDVDSIPTQLHPPMVKVTSADREPRSKPAPPPKPSSLSERQHSASPPTKEFRVSVEMYSQLRHLRKQTKDLRLEVRNLRRIAQSQALTAKETVRETCLKIKTMLAAAQMGEEHVCAERLKVSREEELYRQDVNHLEKDLLELESQVEELRGNVINRKCRVNLSDVEGMALVLSRASKAVAELKARFPGLQESLKTIMAVEMEVVVREEKFLKDEPERLENALRRCKKLTGTLVTLKRLASVQEQRHTVGHHLPEKSHSADGPHSDGEMHSTKRLDGGLRSDPETTTYGLPIPKSTTPSRPKQAKPPASPVREEAQRLESLSLDAGTHTVIHVPPSNGQPGGRQQTALDALLNELQTFTLPAEQKTPRDNIPGLLGPQRRLPSYPSADSPVRSPIHGMPQARSPTNIDPGPKVLQVAPAAKSLSPTPQQQERRPSPTSQLKDAVAKKVPPPPPPRTTSRSPVTSPTEAVTAKPAAPLRSALATRNPPPQRSSSVPTPKGSSHPTLRQTASTRQLSRERPDPPTTQVSTAPTPAQVSKETILRTSALTDDPGPRDQLSSNSSSSESVNSQEGLQMALAAAKAEQRKVSQQLRNELQDEVFATTQKKTSQGAKNRQELLEARHQELLRKQKQLQEQYTRLQQIQRGQVLARLGAKTGDLKKTGSESNILSKAGLLTLAAASGSMQHLAVTGSVSNPITGTKSSPSSSPIPGKGGSSSPANKIFETDIL